MWYIAECRRKEQRPHHSGRWRSDEYQAGLQTGGRAEDAAESLPNFFGSARHGSDPPVHEEVRNRRGHSSEGASHIKNRSGVDLCGCLCNYSIKGYSHVTLRRTIERAGFKLIPCLLDEKPGKLASPSPAPCDKRLCQILLLDVTRYDPNTNIDPRKPLFARVQNLKEYSSYTSIYFRWLR